MASVPTTFFIFWTWAWAIILNLKMAVVPYFCIDITACLSFILTNQTQPNPLYIYIPILSQSIEYS